MTFISLGSRQLLAGGLPLQLSNDLVHASSRMNALGSPDRGQQPGNLHFARGITINLARACGERGQEHRALADLARPYRYRPAARPATELPPAPPGPRVDRCSVDHHRVGLVELTGGRDCLAHGGEIEESRAHWNDHHGR